MAFSNSLQTFSETVISQSTKYYLYWMEKYILPKNSIIFNNCLDTWTVINSMLRRAVRDLMQRIEIVSIQDSIELSQNAMTMSSHYGLQDFRIRCRDTAYLIEECKNTNYRYFLKRLLNDARKLLYSKEKIKIKSYYNIGLPANFHTQDISDEEQFKKDNTYYIIFNLSKNILKMILMCEVNINNIKIDKDENLFSCVLSEKLMKNNEEINFHCIGKKFVWKNREEYYHILLHKHLNRLQQEAIISRRIITKLINEGDENNLSLKFMFTTCKVIHSNAIKTL